jgi:hypothetical protein
MIRGSDRITTKKFPREEIDQVNKKLKPKDRLENPTPEAIFNIAVILFKKDAIAPIHSKKEYLNFQNQLAKLLKINSPKFDKIIFHNKNKRAIINSDLLIHFIQSGLTEVGLNHSYKQSRGGKPTDEYLRLCLQNIRTLKLEGVTTNFISKLIDKTPKSLRKFLERNPLNLMRHNPH